jgi:hypothetical protein
MTTIVDGLSNREILLDFGDRCRRSVGIVNLYLKSVGMHFMWVKPDIPRMRLLDVGLI